jgi:hypothetical protein
MAFTNMMVIGKLPGYNTSIDKYNHFQKFLLKDVTYIDLLPATYKLNMEVDKFVKDPKASINFT